MVSGEASKSRTVVPATAWHILNWPQRRVAALGLAARVADRPESGVGVKVALLSALQVEGEAPSIQ